MAKTITSNVSSAIEKLQKIEEKIDRDILKVFFYAGEEMTAKARQLPADQSYSDQTSNLRSSIGYIVTKKGKVVQTSSFEAVVSETTGERGARGTVKGKNYIESLIGKNDYELIEAAGMEYAKYVQDMPGKDVLAGVALQGEVELKKLLNRLKNKTYKI